MQSMNHPYTKHTNKEVPVAMWQSSDLQSIKKKRKENSPPRQGTGSHDMTAILEHPIWLPNKDTMLLKQQSHRNLVKTFP